MLWQDTLNTQTRQTQLHLRLLPPVSIKTINIWIMEVHTIQLQCIYGEVQTQTTKSHQTSFQECEYFNFVNIPYPTYNQHKLKFLVQHSVNEQTSVHAGIKKKKTDSLGIV